MNIRQRLIAVVAAVLLIASPVVACLWDYDTIREEAAGLPGVLSMIVGKYERHSDAFYEHRAAAMETQLAESPDDLDALDNLAVAKEKLGEVDAAIALLSPVIEQHPDRYTAHANLGTFHLHRYLQGREAADLDRGIELIRRAIEINPDAHFGREKYQLMLAEWMKAGGASDSDEWTGDGDPKFAVFLREHFIDQLTSKDRTAVNAEDPAELAERRAALAEKIDYAGGGISAVDADEVDAARDGVLGMMRFGTGKSPILLETLGDLLMMSRDPNLAAHAYLRAIELDTPRLKLVEAKLERANRSAHGQSAEEIAESFASLRAEADDWVAAFHAFEKDELAAGRDPSSEDRLATFYAEHGDPRDPPARTLNDFVNFNNRQTKQLLAAGGVALVAIAGLVYLRRRRKLQQTS